MIAAYRGLDDILHKSHANISGGVADFRHIICPTVSCVRQCHMSEHVFTIENAIVNKKIEYYIHA